MSRPHNAAGPMLGYLYQCRYALVRSLEEGKTNAGHAVSIERFDDVAFDESDDPFELIQTKHHGKAGDTSDHSVDVWKTLAIWSERVKHDPLAASNTRFVFLTTNTAAADCALAKLRAFGNKRDVDGAIKLLLDVARSSTNKQTASARHAFAAMEGALRKLLVGNIWVLDTAPNILDMRDQIEELLYYAAPKDQLQNFADYLEGWWLRRIIVALSESGSSSISIATIQAKIDELREGFQRAKLPLDDEIDSMPPVVALPSDERVFVRQMHVIALPQKAALAAVHDYYRASEQRSRWARENLLLDGEVERYDRALCDAWQRHFMARAGDLGDCNNQRKEEIGRKVFHWTRSYSKPLRNRDELWLSSGSYQILADAVRVGWHPDFQDLISTGRDTS